jgi:hypothetical protein
MAFSAIVNRDPQGNELHFFSRCFDPLSKGVNVFAQDFTNLQGIFCFPSVPTIYRKVVEVFGTAKVDCVIIIPGTNPPWVNLVSSYLVDLLQVSAPYDHIYDFSLFSF